MKWGQLYDHSSSRQLVITDHVWNCNTRTYSKPAMSNPNGLLSQKVCHYLGQGRTLNGILLRAAHRMAYFDLNPNWNGNRRDKVALRTTCIKNVKFKIIKTRTVLSVCRIFLLQRKLNWAAQNLQPGTMRTAGWT